MKNKKVNFFLLIILLYVLHFSGRFYGLYNYFIATGFLNILLTYYLLKINPFKKMGLFLVFFPLAISLIVVFFGLYNTVPIPGIFGFLIYLISTFFGVVLHFSEKRKILSTVYILIFFISAYQYNNMFNYYYSILEKNKNISKTLHDITVLDFENKIMKLNNNNKIMVIDFWSNSCGNCIKEFPKFEKLKNEFINDNNVDFISINIFNKKTDIKVSKKYLENYTFKKYFTDKSIYVKLDFNYIPNYMVVGKDGKIKYFGKLNMETYETYNNIYKLIENEK